MNDAQRTPDCCPACGGQISSDAVGDSPCVHCGRPLWFLQRARDGVQVLTFLPGLTVGAESGQRVDEVLSAGGTPPRLVLNLAQLRIVSSIFLGMLVKLHKQVLAAQGAMVVCGPGAEAVEALRTTRLDTLFRVCADEDAAIALLGNVD